MAQDMVRYLNNDAFLNIKASFLDDTVKLSEEEAERKKRLRHVHSLRLNNKYSRQQCITIHMREMKVSQATAYRDYSMAMQILGELDMTDKMAERLIAAEDIFQIYQLSLKDRNLELALRARIEYARMLGLSEKESPIDPNKIQAHEYHIHMPRGSSKILDKIFEESGVVNFNSITAEDVNYEDVSDEN